jgi:hypothetical protein
MLDRTAGDISGKLGLAIKGVQTITQLCFTAHVSFVSLRPVARSREAKNLLQLMDDRVHEHKHNQQHNVPSEGMKHDSFCLE